MNTTNTDLNSLVRPVLLFSATADSNGSPSVLVGGTNWYPMTSTQVSQNINYRFLVVKTSGSVKMTAYNSGVDLQTAIAVLNKGVSDAGIFVDTLSHAYSGTGTYTFNSVTVLTASSKNSYFNNYLATYNSYVSAYDYTTIASVRFYISKSTMRGDFLLNNATVKVYGVLPINL